MQLKINWKYVVAFLALNGVISELHEQAHITTGRLLSGCYGERDFNVWQGCATGTDPYPFAAPMAGPLFSYLVMWIGVWLLAHTATASGRSLGFSLVFAPLPFARIFTTLMGGGDERIFLMRVSGDAFSPAALRVGAIALSLLFCAPPIIAAWRATSNRHRGWYIAGFCIVPLLVIWAYKLKVLNGLLQQGVLATPVVIGTPAFVLIVFAFMLAATLLSWRWLQDLDRAGAARPI
jgi:hypothetical protein